MRVNPNIYLCSPLVVVADLLTQAANFDCPSVNRLKSLRRAGVPTDGVGQLKSVAWVKSVSAPTGSAYQH